MPADRWQLIESLCHAALARPAGERAAFLAEACGEDAALRAEVESLVARAASAASFLETPIGGVDARGPLAGRRLGAYRIDAPIAAGGMGEVYRAQDTRLGRDVAIKILPPAFAADPQRRIRFEREARAVAALNHPNICTIHDVGHDDGLDFLVMELVEGESLAARLARGPLPLDEALARATEIADALDRAHRQGIVHRDLKPGNVMLASTGSGKAHGGQAKLLDFGLARIVPSSGNPGALPTVDTPGTRTGAVLGTLQYMAPEQIEGRPADARTDIFAFGALLYEMVTARRAFEASSTAALVAAILREDPAPVHPPEVGRIVRRCMAKEPLRRYQSARDLLNDLEEAQESLGRARLQAGNLPPAEARRRMRGRPAVWLAVGILLAAVTIAAYIAWPGSPAAPAVARQNFQLQPPKGVRVLAAGAASALAVSPDGQWVAFRGRGAPPDEGALYLRFVGDLEPRQIAAGGVVPFFSANSRSLGFFAENGLFTVALDSARPQPRRICDVPNLTAVRGASWGDDGTIVISLHRALWRVPSSGGTLEALTRPASNVRHYWPDVLPGSGAALFTVNEGSSDRWRQIGVVSLASGSIRTFPALSGTAPRYVSSGHIVYSRFGVLYAAPFDLSRLEVTGEPVKVQAEVQTFAGSGSVAYDIADSGSLVYIPEAGPFPPGELIWVDRRGEASSLVPDPRAYVGAALDPGGTRLAAAVADDFGEADLWIYDMDRRTWTQLTSGLNVWMYLAWSPDGRWIVFTSFKSGEGEMFRIPAKGGTPEQLTSDPDGWEHPGSVSADGTVLYAKAMQSQVDLMALTLEPRGTPTPLTSSPQFAERVPRVSPRGEWIAYESDETGSVQVHLRPFRGPGDAMRVSTGGGSNPRWSRDGRQLFYQRGPEVWAVRVGPKAALQRPELLFKAEFTELVSVGPADRFVAIRRDPPDRQLVYVPNWLEEMKRAVGQRP